MQFAKLLLLTGIFTTIFPTTHEIAYICVPVADLLLYPIKTKLYRSLSQEERYERMPFEPCKGRYNCPRVHQALFNEQVIIHYQLGQEVQIELRSCFFESAFHKEPQCRYWTLKKWLITQKELEEHAVIPTTLFPIPLDFRKRFTQDKNSVTLQQPWLDSTTNTWYSAGTRFIPGLNSTVDSQEILFFDPVIKAQRNAYIPRDLCAPQLANQSDRQKYFVSLLAAWTRQQPHIAYVWGGASFANTYTRPRTLYTFDNCDEPYSQWDIPSEQRPLSGIECSSMFLRAAQIAGLPYFYKNSITLLSNLKQFKIGDTLEEGDIIWYPGHVMLVGSLENNEIIEARGNASGYGCVHMLPLSKYFTTITTWSELIDAYHHNKPLQVLNKQGNPTTQLQHFSILKLSSMWQTRLLTDQDKTNNSHRYNKPMNRNIKMHTHAH